MEYRRLKIQFFILIVNFIIFYVTGMVGELPDDLRLEDLYNEMDNLIGGDTMEVDKDEASSDIGAQIRDLLAKKKEATNAPGTSTVSLSGNEFSSY
jgi:hypothetical protein